MSSMYFQVPYYVNDFKPHKEIQSTLLSLIEQANFDSKDGLTKTDWFMKDKPQLYKDFIIPYLQDAISEILPDKNLKILDCWFQQYKKYSYHSWHDHKCQWAMVYYVTLPFGSKPTQFRIDKQEYNIDATEGDFVIFPGWIQHRSPINKTTEPKTIISINFEEFKD